ncbi:Fungal specific transcription factor domain [Ceratobasidium sp. AG-Ba]|nr:Fungal specific transcription factor domain [Ceratobasidium sp. AG-Ba]QRW01830.1 Fungal specific transcription factor domain [Ceratobasidium sp. AG-Ba]
MPSPHGSYPQDAHQLQPNAPGYYHGLRQPSPHQLMPPPPVPLDPSLGGHLPNPHSPATAQPQYAYPPMFSQQHLQMNQGRPPMYGTTAHLSNSTETENGSDDEDDQSGDDEPAANDKRTGKKRASKSAGGSASKKAKQSANDLDDDDDDDSPAPAPGGSAKPKATRGSKACTNCRRLKMKCVGVSADKGPPCDRCRNNGQECIFEESNRGKKPSKKQENLLRQLKRMESTLDTLMHSISHPGLTSIPAGTVSRSPTPSSPSVTVNARTLLGSPSVSTPDMGSTSGSSVRPQQKPRSSSPRLHMLPDNTLNPLGLLAEASLQNRREKGPSTGLGASDAYFKPGMRPTSSAILSTNGPAGPMNILPLRRLYIERQVQPEMLSFVSTEEVVELFDIYFDHLNAQCGMLERGFHTPSMVCSRSPFLLTTICAIASKFYTKRPELHLRLSGISKKLAFSVPERGYKSVEIVQAYILLSLWGSGPVERYEQDKTWLMLGLAIRLATDLNLHRKSTAQLDDTPESQARSKEIRNRERTWLLCYILDRSLSAQMGKPHSVKEDYIIRNSGQWWQQPEAIPQDAGVVAYLELQRILSRSLDFLYSGTSSASGLQTDCDYLLVIKTVESQLQAWSNEWEFHRRSDRSPGSEYRSLVAVFYYNYAMLVVNSFGLQNAMERSHVDIAHFFSRCHSSATACATVVRDELAPRGYMRYSPDSHFVFTSYAVLTLLKLIRPEFSAFLGNESKTLPIVQEIAEVLEKIAANPYHTPALYSTFLRALINAKKDAVTAPPSPGQNSRDRSIGAEDQSQHTGPTISPDDPMSDPVTLGMGLRMFPPTGDGALSSSDFLHTGDSVPQLDESFPPQLHGHGGTDDLMPSGMEHIFANGFWDNVLMPGYGNQLGGLSGGFVYGVGGNSGFITPRIGSPFASGAATPVREGSHLETMNFTPSYPVFRDTN